MSDEENIEINPFFEVVRDSVAHRDSLQEKDEAEQKKAYQEHQKILSQSKTNLANDVRSAIKAIPPMKLNVEGSIEFESEAFAWMIREEKPNPLNGEERKPVLCAGSSIFITQDGKVLQKLSGHKDIVRCVTHSPDGLTIASCSDDKTVRLWDVRTGDLLRTMQGHDAEVNSVCYSPDGMVIVSGSSDWTVRLWNANTGELIRTLNGHNDTVLSVSFSPDGTRIASGSADKTVLFWNAKSGDFVNMLDAFLSPVSLSYSPDGMMIATLDNALIRIYHTGTGEELLCLDEHLHKVNDISFSPDGTTIASCDGYSLRLWDAQSGEQISKHPPGLPMHWGKNRLSLCYASDSETVCIGFEKLWAEYKMNNTMKKHGDFMNDVLSISFAFREASEVFNIIKETNTHLGELGFEIITEDGLEFILSWNKKIE